MPKLDRIDTDHICQPHRRTSATLAGGVLNRMLKFLHLLYPSYALPDDELLTRDREEMAAVAERARARLAENGMLQVELDAQREIRRLLRDARIGRSPRGGASVTA